MASIDFDDLEPRERYKLIVGAVVPRPIALMTTIDLSGNVNAAPFSFFNAMCNDPPALAIGVNRSAPGRKKDTAENVEATGEFVVNLVSEDIAERMNVCEVEFPPDVDELAMAGFSPLQSAKVGPPRIAEAPVSFECKLIVNVQIAAGRNVIIGQVVHMHIRDDCYDAEKNYVLADKLGLIARMHGPGCYARTSDLFEMPRLSGQEKAERFGIVGLERPPLGRDRR